VKATIDRKQLVKALQEVKKTVAKRVFLPITQNVIIKANGNLTITSTDLENSISVAIPVESSVDGEICLNPRILLDTIKASKEKQVTIESQERGATVSMNGTSVHLATLDVIDFPAIPKVEGNTIIVDLAEALDKVIHGVATEEQRPVLTGVCFTSVEGKLRIASADGFRLAIATIEAQGTIEKQIILNSKACAIIAKMPQPVTLTITDSIVKAQSGNMTLTAMVIQGTFPDYTKLIPQNSPYVLTVDASALLQAVKQCAIIAKDGSGIVRLESEGDCLKVSAKAEDIGTTEVKIPCQGEIKIAVNQRYIAEALTCVDGDITIETSSPSSPMVVKQIDQDSFLEVIMPMFVDWGKTEAEKAQETKQEVEAIEDAESEDTDETHIDTQVCEVVLSGFKGIERCIGEQCWSYCQCWPNNDLKVYHAGIEA
jgi:DNA polymerase-3 subunit beta